MLCWGQNSPWGALVKVESALLHSRESALVNSLKSALAHFPSRYRYDSAWRPCVNWLAIKMLDPDWT